MVSRPSDADDILLTALLLSDGAVGDVGGGFIIIMVDEVEIGGRTAFRSIRDVRCCQKRVLFDVADHCRRCKKKEQ